MSIEREVHEDVRTLLMSGQPFQFAHLIKFERPSRPDTVTGAVSTSASRYTYLTDASRNVSFDDGSTDNAGVANGSQVYIANKVLNVSAVQESIEAKASNFTITLDGNGIGASITANVTITAPLTDYWDIDFPDNIDIIAQGFREGDKIELTGITSGEFNIDSFRAGNVLRIKKIESSATVGTGAINISLASEEIKSILLNKNDADYSSFINREVYIYRAYFIDGKMVGETPDSNGIRGPILLFKGIISNVSFEDTDNSIKVQWGLTSHWGDFAQVKGRITSDEFHRALDATGLPQPASAIKPAYAYDKGFMHAETSINLLATYYVKVEKQKVKSKSGFLGLGVGSKVKVKKYFVKEPRYSELDFQLKAKAIPLIYGVRNVEGTPVFADTLLDDTSTVYMALVLSEGEIGGIYDVYVEGKSLICANEADYDTRHEQNKEKTIDVLCTGRADRGDVLSGTTSTTPEVTDYYDSQRLKVTMAIAQFFGFKLKFKKYNPPISFSASSSGPGLIHGTSLQLTEPQSITIDFFSGREGQEAASQLVTVSKAENFKIQNDYWTGGDTAEYWGPNHRLLDTAYVAVKVKIKEGETTIPDMEFIVRGKTIDCYNYDYSFSHDEKAESENPDSFKLGQTVTLYDINDTSMGVRQIIDKWSFYRPDGVKETRFRYDSPPDLLYDSDGVPTKTKFYMSDGTNRWTMTTFNYELDSGTVPEELSSPVNSIENNNGNFQIITDPDPELITGGDDTTGTPYYSIRDEFGNIIYANAIFQSETPTNGVIETPLSYVRMSNY